MKDKYIKIFVLLLSVFVLSGCVNVKTDSIEQITKYITSSKRELYNNYNRGYKFYIPKGLSASKTDNLNVIIKSQNYDYYLYVDLVSYYNKVEFTYNTDSSLYYSSNIKGKDGLLNITKLYDGYLIHIQYNYAKLEVVVSEKEIKNALSNALIIVNSIKYNDNTIRAMLDEGVLSTNEKVVEVFNNSNNSTDLQEIDDDVYIEDDDIDVDYIN
jgi:hypothetical protein